MKYVVLNVARVVVQVHLEDFVRREGIFCDYIVRPGNGRWACRPIFIC